MRYIFEKMPLTGDSQCDDREFPNDEAAIRHALRIGADYVWDCHPDYNPRSVWDRPRVSPEMHANIKMRLEAWLSTLKLAKKWN